MQAGNPPECNLEGVEHLIKGCSAHLQGLSAVAAGSVDLPSTLLLNGWLQRYCFTCAILAVFARTPSSMMAHVRFSLALHPCLLAEQLFMWWRKPLSVAAMY